MCLLEKLVNNPVTEQVIFIFLNLLLTACSMYYLTTSVIRNKMKRSAGIIAGLFYMLNPYVMTNIWHRAAYSMFFILPVFPLVLGLYIRGIEKKKYVRYAFLINIVLLLFSIAFLNPAYIIVLWFLLFSVSSIFLLKKCNDRLVKNLYSLVKFFAITFFLWILFNLWWLLPLTITTSDIFSRMTSTINTQIFEHVSQDYAIENVIQLMHGTNFYKIPLYSTPLFQLLGVSIPICVFSVLLFKPKRKFVLFFSCLALFGVFLSKGTQPPLGQELTLWMFKNIRILQVFRNPFEKLGLITALSYAFLFGLGLSIIHIKLKNAFHTRLSARTSDLTASFLRNFYLFLIIGLFVFPMWTGQVLAPWVDDWDHSSWFVDVPSYVEEAEIWLSEQKDLYRIIGLPMSLTRSVDYNWSSGYLGMNPWNLYGKTMITTSSDVSFINDIISYPRGDYQDPCKAEGTERSLGLLQYRLKTSNQFWKYLGLFNVKYVCIHRDVLYPSEVSIATSPECISSYLIGNHSILQRDFSIQIADCETTEYWGLYGGAETAEINIDNSSFVEGESSLRITNMIPEGSWEGGIQFDLPENFDLTNCSLSFWIKINSMSNVSHSILRVYDSYGDRERGWKLIEDIVENEWTEITIDLNSWYSQSSSAPDMSDVDYISFGIFSTVDTPAIIDWSFDDLKYYPDDYAVGQDHIKYVRTFGELDFYEVDSANFIPRIYASNQYVFASDAESMLDLIHFGLDPRDFVIFLESQSSMHNIASLEEFKPYGLYKPEIVFEQINPTHYIIQVTNATEPFFITFLSTYDEGWKAFIGSYCLPYEQHFIANGYANCWLLDDLGSYEINLIYEPQKLFIYGSSISIASFTFCISCLVVNRIKDRMRIRLHIRLQNPLNRETNE